jgi:Na+-driven multidrug efflux pump
MNFALWRRRLGIVPKLSDWFVPRWRRLAQVMHIGLPGGGENVAYRVCFMINLAFVAVIGAEALATHTYLLQISYFILLSGLAIGFGTEIVVGHHIGAGQLKMADRVVIKALQYGLCSSVLLALTAALAGTQIFGLFSSDPVVVSMGVKVLWVLVFLEPGRTFNLVVINGLRAAGDARFPVGFGVFSMVAVGVGFAWLFGVHLGWGLVGIWIGFAADEWVRGLVMFARWRYLAWVPHAKRARRQIRDQYKG